VLATGGVRTLRRRLFLGAFIGLLHAGCKEKPPEALAGSGVPLTETRDVPPFTRLSVASRIEARVTIGEASKLDFRGDNNLLPHLKSRVENGELKLDTDVNVKPSIPLRVTFSVPRLETASVSRAAQIVIEGMKAETFEAHARDGAKISASGTAQALVLEGVGAGWFDFQKLPARSATIRLEYGARAEMGYLEKLDVKLSGAARVSYVGTPEIKKDIKSTSARLIRRDER